jgi:phospholipase/lecithinase/hemolysin
MAGTNDILELYQQFPAQTEAQITAQLVTRGRALAAQVNRLANANGRIVVSTVPDVGTMPYGLAQKAAHTDTDRSALLSRLTQSYNSAMRLDLINDGRLIGLVLLDETLNQAIRFPGFQGLVNVNTAACATALPNCTTATLVTDASATTWLWSDSTRLSPRGQSILSQLALTRAVSNPF